MRVSALPLTNDADRHCLSLFSWQLIGALSFKDAKFSEGRQVASFKSALRKVMRALGVRYQDTVWALKLEWGRWGERAHFHFVLTGLPGSQVADATCKQLKRAWHQKGGGREADIEVFDPTKGGLAYIAKLPAIRLDNNFRSTSKFGVDGENIHFSGNFVQAANQSPFRTCARSSGSLLRE